MRVTWWFAFFLSSHSLVDRVNALVFSRTRRNYADADEAHHHFLKNTTPPRDVPNGTPKECATAEYNYPETMTITIVMCYKSEPEERLFTSLKTILFRTKVEELDEIIAIDDANDDGMNKSRLDEMNLPKVRSMRSEEPMGLMRCRTWGADQVKSPIIVFLDSHIEVVPGWLPPLLQPLTVPKSSAVPVCDIIDPETAVYEVGPNWVRGGMDWRLSFIWRSVPQDQRTHPAEPYSSPVMVGGLFAITTAWWEESGKYDQGMQVWGMENIEMSLRHWTCGGRVMISPCSRVGHIFKKEFPYSFGTAGNYGVTGRNAIRTAQVWMDDYFDVFLQTRFKNTDIPPDIDVGDTSDRVELRKHLKCETFQWYLDNIDPMLKTSLDEQIEKK